MKRSFDLFLACILMFILFIPMLIVALAVKLSSEGPVLFVSDRVGQDNHLFKMLKFRSMKLGTPTVGTHLLIEPEKFLTTLGSYLRQSSIDELPQLWNIIQGDMSFVGPRPALYNQSDLIALRTEKSIDSMLPGLTGWAQINGRDDLSIHDKVSFDQEYMLRQSFNFDLKILWLTYLKVIRKDSISH
tara:strand:- start:92 stop:652 length:561 start_codon:yes stop_codon:yes gene_type:complete